MNQRNAIICLAAASFALLLWVALLVVPGATVAQEINTTVNITNARPEVRDAVLDAVVDLESYGEVTVNCSAVVFDWDNDTLSVNASLYLSTVANPDSTLDNNTIYWNTSCTQESDQDRQMDFLCTFPVQYYADNSTQWICNVTVEDDENAYHSNLSDFGEIRPLVAIYVPGQLDFGNLAYNDISDDKLANITNAGNRNLTILTEGYGVSPGDGLAMNCTYGNIPVSNERYNRTSGADWNTEMVLLTSAPLIMDGLMVEHRFDDLTIEYSTNSTFWKLKIPPLAGGVCTGRILFTAQDLGI